MSTIRTMRNCLAALLLPVLAACGTGEAGDAPSFQSASVERGNLIVTADATGILEPVRKVEVTSKASGEILRLHVDVGDEVEPGALLAEVDPRDVRNEANQATADIEVARARIDIAERQVERSQDLLESGVISPQEHESRTLEFANARAGLIKARTNLELAQLRLEDVTIRAPLAGTILEKNVEEGQVIQSSSQNVSAGTTLMIMANLDVIQVRILVDESDLGEISEGQRTSVMVDAYPGRTFVGVVNQIEPQAVVQRSGTTFPLIVELDNRSRLLKPGMNSEVAIQTGEANGVLLIPNNSVVMPQDAEPAALTLGLDAEAVDFENDGARPESGRPGSDAGGDQEAMRERMRERMASGDVPQDFARMQFGQSGQRGMREGGGVNRFAQGGHAMGAPRAQRAVVFVVGEDETIEARQVMIGLTDWDRTEVVSGLEEGDRVALIGLAQLQAQREEFLERMRSMTGNPFGRGGMPGMSRGMRPH